MTTKNELFEKIEAQKEKLCEMADFIFDHPEYRGKEYQACDLLTKYLTDNGFSVEKSVGGYETSFRAEWKHGEGGPVIGILCEYDALEGLGHGCGHHMKEKSDCKRAQEDRKNQLLMDYSEMLSRQRKPLVLSVI